MTDKPTTNNLQTLANGSQTRANILATRKGQMIALALLTAFTLVGQYVLLGTMGLGRAAEALPEWFFIFEKILWGFRGIVEIMVVVYVGMTKPTNEKEERNLWRFEAVLIAFIVLTVGPVWGSLALNVKLLDILTWWGVVAWGMGLAGISATMLAAVAYAYKVQSVDTGYFVLPFADYEKMLMTVTEAVSAKAEALSIADTACSERDKAAYELRGMREAVGILRLLPPSAQVQIVALFANGRPDESTLAETFGLSRSTVRGVFARLNSGEQIDPVDILGEAGHRNGNHRKVG